MKLFEIKSAPLYRNAFPFDVWFHVLKSDNDTIQAYQRHKLHGKTIVGTSFTRNKQLAHKTRSFGPVVFEVDQQSLAQTHKIIPIDAEYAHYLARNRSAEHDPVARRAYSKFNDRAGGTGTHEMGAPMAEEFVVGDIKPLSKYLISITVFSSYEHGNTDELPYYKDFVEAINLYSEKHNVPLYWKD